MTRREFLNLSVTGAGALVLAACGAKTETSPAGNYRPLETEQPVATETYKAPNTPTVTPEPTEASTPTEAAPFTKPEVEAADSFDKTTFPERFQKMCNPEYAAKATDKEREDFDAFLKAVRVDDGIAETLGGSDELKNFYEARDWIKAHPEEVKTKERQGKLLQISPLETKALIEQKYHKAWQDKKTGRNYGFAGIVGSGFGGNYGSENIGDILGMNIESGRWPFDKVYGDVIGFGEIDGRTVILLDVKNPDGTSVVFAAAIFVGKGPTLRKDSKCIVLNQKFVDKNGGSPIYTLPQELSLEPLKRYQSKDVVSWEELLDMIGENVEIFGGYSGELGLKTGITEMYAFTPEGLEMTGTIRKM